MKVGVKLSSESYMVMVAEKGRGRGGPGKSVENALNVSYTPIIKLKSVYKRPDPERTALRWRCALLAFGGCREYN